MTELVLTHAAPGVDRRGKLCRCSRCGLTERCAPESDFYTCGDNRLVCEECLRRALTKHGLVTPGW